MVVVASFSSNFRFKPHVTLIVVLSLAICYGLLFCLSFCVSGWTEELIDDYFELFTAIDLDHSGFIDVPELEWIFRKLDLKFSRKRIGQMIDEVGGSGSGSGSGSKGRRRLCAVRVD